MVINLYTIYILRHGAAEPLVHDDADRALTPRGEEEVLMVGKHLLTELNNTYGMISNTNLPINANIQTVPSINQIATSPYKRAVQTASIVGELLGIGEAIHIVEELTPNSTPQEAIQQLSNILSKTKTKTLLIVSHMPLVGKLTDLFCTGSSKEPVSFGTGTVIKLELDFLVPGLGRILWRKDSTQGI